MAWRAVLLEPPKFPVPRSTGLTERVTKDSWEGIVKDEVIEVEGVYKTGAYAKGIQLIRWKDDDEDNVRLAYWFADDATDPKWRYGSQFTYFSSVEMFTRLVRKAIEKGWFKTSDIAPEAGAEGAYRDPRED